jgi:DNA-binding NarL/FixJ family response regulator
MAVHILVADDHPLFRDAIKSAISIPLGDDSEPPVVSEAEDFGSAMAALAADTDTDLVLLDLSMPGSSGLSALVSVRAAYPSVPVIVISGTDDVSTVRRSIELGASGFISKSARTDAIRKGVADVLAGEIALPDDMNLGSEHDPEIGELIRRLRTLTPQQARVLGMLAEGLLNKQIAYELGVSEATIKAHVSAVLQKLNVDSRTQAVIQLSKIGADMLREDQD